MMSGEATCDACGREAEAFRHVDRHYTDRSGPRPVRVRQVPAW